MMQKIFKNGTTVSWSYDAKLQGLGLVKWNKLEKVPWVLTTFCQVSVKFIEKFPSRS